MSEKILPLETSEERMAEQVADASRMGRFTISAQLFTSNVPLVRQVLAWLDFFPHFVTPVQAPAPGMEYIGQSPRFESLTLGDQIPEYLIRVRQCDDGLVFGIERHEEKRIIVPGRG